MSSENDSKLTLEDRKALDELTRARKLYDVYLEFVDTDILDVSNEETGIWPHQPDLPLSLKIERTG